VDEALAKIKPELRGKALAGGEELVHVFVTAAEGTNVGRYMVQSLTRPLAILGEQTTFGKVKAGSLLKLASLEGVTSIQPIVFAKSGEPIPPPEPELIKAPSLEELRARMDELKAIDIPWTPESDISTKRPDLPTGWFDVGPGHKSKAAWAKGYTGEGVLVAVLDDGVDFGHPDLMGTQALVKDPSSPYYGWPMAFDPYSMLLYVYDCVFGTTFVADGWTWYSDTSTELFRPVGSYYIYFKGVPYKVPLTSKSGRYHIGYHPDDNLLEFYEERAAVLVVDERVKEIYDTVYVDLDNDQDFTDEKPVTRDSPISYRDMDGDGYTDISGGLVYFIADGKTPIPVSDWLWGPYAPPPDNGDLVAFHGALDEEWSHGTLCASNVVGQGVINGMAPTFRDLPGDGTPGGVVVGGAPDAEMVAVSDIYYNFDASVIDAYTFSVFGYDGIPGSGDEMQITSNSYGESDIDNDGWDYKSRYVDRLVRRYSPTITFLFSTGNGAPGYGTVAPPCPTTGMGIGASTQFGSTGWDSIAYTTQIAFGDVIQWSNRGPGARGNVGVNVVADGAFASGAGNINYYGFNGWYSWETWGGTSRSSPVAMSNLALVYQAFKEKNGRWPSYEEARAIFMSGASNLDYDVFVQGAGSVNADRATDVAGGLYGVYVMPESWRAGDYRGVEYPGFANILKPGEVDTQVFTVFNPSPYPITVSLSDDVMRRIGSVSFDFTTKDMAEENDYSFNAPDYLIPIDPAIIPADTDLMIVRMKFPFEQFDPDGDYEANQLWRMLVYSWMDINGDGNLWEDLDGNGVVNHVDKEPEEPANIDGFPALDFAKSEIDQYEYVRFAYHRTYGDNFQVWVHDPLGRMADGLFIGLQHPKKDEAIPTTSMSFQIDFYSHGDWDMLSVSPPVLTVPAGGSATFDATVAVPANAATGIYEGAIFVDDPGDATHGAHRTVVPVVVSVAADFIGTLELGGAAANDPDAIYNNGAVRGDFDWSWRAESGDWRFFFLDVPSAPAPGTKLIIRDVWDDVAPPTDIDTLVMGPCIDRFTDHEDRYYDPDYYGPYTLETVGNSPNTYIGHGTWKFNTATGGPEEWVTASLVEGLHLIAQHNVLYSGRKFNVPFAMTVATVSVVPPTIEITTTVDSGSMPITFTSGIELAGLAVEGYGLSVPLLLPDQLAYQDDPDDPATASHTYVFSLAHASSLAASTGNAPGQDIDLYVYYDANGDGVFEYPGEVIGSSTTPTDEEFVSVKLPDDGSYMVAVHGWSVSPSPATFDLTIEAIQGYDLTISGVPVGAIPANTPVTFTMSYGKAMLPGETWKGEILLGPSVAPAALTIPVTIHRQ